MSHTKRQRIPAAAILAGGITRHGPHCQCGYCRHYCADDAGVIQPPVARELVSVGEAFEATRAVVAQLEVDRDDIVRAWSPAQTLNYKAA